ncbi:MAG TPA: Zn-ribbon domain-containing OB-fold protein [Acidimicrobiia bacterium]|nr:Zn-ribbon domain-containing OB-fold protein [Acidimicrobiia bacterium]
MAPTSPARPLPVPTPETQHFWDGTAAGELRLQRCRSCARTYFPPQPFCPACSSDDVEIVRASGHGSLSSYVITRLAAPGFDAPYVIALVELDEGPRMLTNLVGVDPDPESLPLDLPVEVVYETFGDVTLPRFRPRP